MTAEAKSAFLCPTGPYGLQVDTDRREDWHVKNGEDILRQIFRLFKLECDAAKAEVQHAGSTVALLTDGSVGVGPKHGNALRFTLDGVPSRSFGLWRNLLHERTGGRGGIGEARGSFLERTAIRDG